MITDIQLPGDLELRYRLGQGGAGTVYAAWDPHRQQQLAVKVIPLDSRAGEKELDAVAKYRQLHHPDLLPVWDFSAGEKYLYYTMPLADSTLAKCGRLPVDECRRMGVAILNALEELHRAGFIHRDIKPANILVLDNHYLLGDPGLLAPESSASFAGTPGFIPPEVWSQQKLPDESSDLYAVGKVLYCALTGNDAGRFPEYSGSGGRDAAELMQLILMLCRHPQRFSIVKLRKFLLHPGMFLETRRRKKQFSVLAAAVAGSVIIAAAAIAWRYSRPSPQQRAAAGTETASPPGAETENGATPDIDIATVPPEVWRALQQLPLPEAAAMSADQQLEVKLQKFDSARTHLIRQYRQAAKDTPAEELAARYGETAFFQLVQLEKSAGVLKSRLNHARIYCRDCEIKLLQLDRLAKLSTDRDYSRLVSPLSAAQLREKLKFHQEQAAGVQQQLIANYQRQLDLLQRVRQVR